jgi:hypothetical protein
MGKFYDGESGRLCDGAILISNKEHRFLKSEVIARLHDCTIAGHQTSDPKAYPKNKYATMMAAIVPNRSAISPQTTAYLEFLMPTEPK